MMTHVIGNILSSSWQAVRKTGEIGAAVGRAVQSEVSNFLDPQDAAQLSGKDKAVSLRLTRGVLQAAEMGNPEKKAVLAVVGSVESGQVEFRDSRQFRQAVQKHLGEETSAKATAQKHPNFFPSLLANARPYPPLKCTGRVAFDFQQVPAKDIHFASRQGRVYAEVTTSLNQLLGDTPRTRQIAEDYASDDISLKLTIPLGDGPASGYQSMPVAAKRQLLKNGLKAAPQLTTFVHGFQSTKEIWDSSAAQWTDPKSVAIAFDGFGGDGQARSDGSSPYTPKQYGFQVLEALDALGLLGGKELKVVGHSMGGGASAEMAVALDKAGYTGEANFVLMAPACSADHMPVFQAHRDLMDVVNAVLIGGIYVPLGAWDLTAPAVQWTDEKFPLISKLVVDYGLGLKDSPEHIRDHNAGYYRSGDAHSNRVRRQRSLEAMMGMATQKGIDAKELRQAGKRFGIFVANFATDRLVDPQSVSRLKGKGIGYLEVGGASHNAGFSPDQAQRLAEASQRYFEGRTH